MGVDRIVEGTTIPGIGPDFTASSSAQHFSSWPSLAPGAKFSGGKRLSGRDPSVVNRIARSSPVAAVTVRRSQPSSAPDIARLGKAVAVDEKARA